ncbi:hypothetical protein SAMN05444851_1644 [Aliiroseovarius sediminilitoris]|uniref:Uncharacterized protein n=1 Tax=Aliiroseovarius sediminilitoris TaxID=1173584 RepID=A0A1I0PJ58_9RHOB|nr:hypothetical protein [Aliiroseovarius sediminilitoris]SEW13817.1 hypothetical protein SAMN05444851_1644 [Aliiroseovarius sediminilitoris]
MTDLIKAIDPRGLIRESYRIEGIRIEECRSIFLDWALFDDHEMAQAERITTLLDHYGADAPDHPMTQVMRLALDEAATPKRRGGRKGRVG